MTEERLWQLERDTRTDNLAFPRETVMELIREVRRLSEIPDGIVSMSEGKRLVHMLKGALAKRDEQIKRLREALKLIRDDAEKWISAPSYSGGETYYVVCKRLKEISRAALGEDMEGK